MMIPNDTIMNDINSFINWRLLLFSYLDFRSITGQHSLLKFIISN